MIAHRDEIYSRPKKTWFLKEKEKKLVAKEAKVISNCIFFFFFFLRSVIFPQNQFVHLYLFISWCMNDRSSFFKLLTWPIGNCVGHLQFQYDWVVAI
jgi:hypothetical protein